MNEKFIWTQGKIDKLVEMYPLGNMNTILDYFGIDKTNRSILYIAAKKYGIKRARSIQSKCDLSPLLNDSLEAFYWMGFLLADGCFLKGALLVKLAEKDEKHLELLASFLGMDHIRHSTTKPKGKFKACNCVDIRGEHKAVVDALRIKFDIKPRKTYFPPDTSKWDFTDDQYLALIIGFIDGDGAICIKQNCFTTSISNHLSWTSFHTWIITKLISVFGTSNAGPYIRKDRNQSVLEINHPTMFHLTKFVHSNKIPFLNRKWEKLFSHDKFNR